MEPLKITFNLMTPIRVPDYPIHLDSLIAWAAVEEAMENGLSMDAAQLNLPISKCDHENEYVWMASWIDFEPGERDSFYMIRQFNLTDTVLDGGHVYHALRRNKWDQVISSSPYKAYMMSVPTRHTSSATAWVIGDKEKIEHLLKRITHLGKLKRLNLGKIKSIIVTQNENAHKFWKWRTLPWQEPGYAKVFETTKPPYWKRENRQIASVPGSSTANL